MKAVIIVLTMVAIVAVKCNGNPVSQSSEAITVQNCGTVIAQSPRIVGGRQASQALYPWMISLHDIEKGSKHVCGGAILNENWVITAAHCVENVSPSNYFIIVGLNKQSEQNASTVQKLEVSKIVSHEKFDHTFINDIAILKTAKPIDIAGSRGYVNGICLPITKEDPTPTGSIKVIGWGHDHEKGQNMDTLKEVEVPVVPRNLCNEFYNGSITEDMICAGMENKDSCQNDSGGPLFETNSDGVSTLIGIVSHGDGCGEKYHPGVYTKVSSYIEWMQTMITEDTV